MHMALQRYRHRAFIQSNQNLETAEMSLHSGMDKYSGTSIQWNIT